VKEAMAGHKVGHTATGCSGVVSWNIHAGKILAVMYSVPYNQDWYSNWLAVGIFDEQDTAHFFDKMYEGREIEFKRKEFYWNTNRVEYTCRRVATVTATMGTSHKPEILVKLYPEVPFEYAAALQGQNIDA